MAFRLFLGRLPTFNFASTLVTRQLPLHYTAIRTIITTNPSDVRLNNLRDNDGAVKRSVRVGRGIGTGTGKTSKRGHKGQKARTGGGKPMPGFVGGGKPLYKSMRKYGFKNTRFARRLQGVNLEAVQHHINNGTLNPYKPITVKELYDSGAVGKQVKDGVKILAKGAEGLTTPNLHFEVNDCSAAARDAIQNMGGKVDLVYHNTLALRYTLRPEKFLFKPKFARPTPKLHYNKYPNFPEPTPFDTPAQVLEDLEYAPDFTAKLKAEKKDRVTRLKKLVKEPRKTIREQKKSEILAQKMKLDQQEQDKKRAAKKTKTQTTTKIQKEAKPQKAVKA